MNKRYKCLQMGLLMTVMISGAKAQQFDHSFQKWKDEQVAQDQRLNRQNDQHYLSKPSTTNTKRQSSSATSRSAKVKINSASVSEFQQIRGIGEKKAQAIVEYRQQNGPFKAVEDLQNVKGIGPKFIEKNRTQLSL